MYTAVINVRFTETVLKKIRIQNVYIHLNIYINKYIIFIYINKNEKLFVCLVKTQKWMTDLADIFFGVLALMQGGLKRNILEKL